MNMLARISSRKRAKKKQKKELKRVFLLQVVIH